MFSDPQQILSQIDIKQGSIVCDVGAGSGFYSLPVSKLVGDGGKVYAIDIQKDLLTRLSNEAHGSGRTNIEVVWGDAEKQGGTKLREGLADVAIVANILFQVEKKDAFLVEIRRILKSHGRVVFIDWTDSFNNLGPHPEMVITKEKAETLFAAAGMTVEKEIDAGAHHYGIIFKKG